MRRAVAIMLFLLLAGVAATGAWWLGYRSAVQQVADRGDAFLRSASDRLVAQLAIYRLVAVRLAEHPQVLALARGENAGADQLFRRVADETGALEVAFYDRQGVRRASSDGATIHDMDADGAALNRALSGALGFGHGLAGGRGQRAFVFMAPVFADGRPAGALAVRVDLEAVEESDWRGAPQVVFFTDARSRIFVSNRSELLFEYLGAGGVSPSRVRTHANTEVWDLDRGRYVPGKAVYRTQPLPVIGMQGHVLISTEPADRIGLLQGAVVGALFLSFGALLLLLSERRRALALANESLEARVAARTEELARANDSLRIEVAERKEAEEALRRAQSELVQAGKLSALGKMSAGISHELNQPLMAIRSFSENAAKFLDTDRPEDARGNLMRVSDLAHRMARIIKNLRAFARQEVEPMSPVDVVAVVDTVLELLEPRLRDEAIILDWVAPEMPVRVTGGEVRLQQVVMNLVTNALDAMAGQTARHLAISVAIDGGIVRLDVADNGPGLDDPDKIFDPFYSTKTVGSSEEGMGLGLSISYGLVQSFGGAIRGRNAPEGGAVFTVELNACEAREAAE